MSPLVGTEVAIVLVPLSGMGSSFSATVHTIEYNNGQA